MISKLHYISQPAIDGSHITAIKNALDAGCRWIQLRVKDAQEADVLAYAVEAVALCRPYGAKLIVNDFPEIALKAGADGVHLGLEDMPVSKAREIVGNKFIIGGTANTISHVLARIAEGVDYIGLGPFRFTTTKKKLSPILGLDGYTDIMNEIQNAGVKTPVIAIGGIETNDIPHIMRTGIYGVAISGAITHAADRTSVVNSIYAYLDSVQITSAANL
jgi:thiamine-phosphate pyrophosphorylase